MILLLAYRPFLDPLPVWNLPYSLWMPILLLPLTVGVAIVYKTIKCRLVSQIAQESAELTGWIILFMAVAAVMLTVIVRGLEHWIDS